MLIILQGLSRLFQVEPFFTNWNFWLLSVVGDGDKSSCFSLFLHFCMWVLCYCLAWKAAPASSLNLDGSISKNVIFQTRTLFVCIYTVDCIKSIVGTWWQLFNLMVCCLQITWHHSKGRYIFTLRTLRFLKKILLLSFSQNHLPWPTKHGNKLIFMWGSRIQTFWGVEWGFQRRWVRRAMGGLPW